jgi:hypothetical protein
MIKFNADDVKTSTELGLFEIILLYTSNLNEKSCRDWVLVAFIRECQADHLKF